jgi:hypothetical protein
MPTRTSAIAADATADRVDPGMDKPMVLDPLAETVNTWQGFPVEFDIIIGGPRLHYMEVILHYHQLYFFNGYLPDAAR